MCEIVFFTVTATQTTDFNAMSISVIHCSEADVLVAGLAATQQEELLSSWPLFFLLINLFIPLFHVKSPISHLKKRNLLRRYRKSHSLDKFAVYEPHIKINFVSLFACLTG